MTKQELLDGLITLAPELWLAGMALLLLLAGLFIRPRWGKIVILSSVATLIVALALLGSVFSVHQSAMGGMFIDDSISRFGKYLIFGTGIGALLIAWPYLKTHGIANFEYSPLIILSILGMCLMVSAHNFLSLYMGLELQSLALYVLATFKRDDLKSSEAGLKYFVLGALSSGILLFGISLLYGMTGTIDFEGLRSFFITNYPTPTGANIGLIFTLAALGFKVSAVPFHMWTPDVYEGAPTPVTGFFSVVSKIAGLILLTRVLYTPFIGMAADWRSFVMFLAIASMLLGSFAAIMQDNIKRLMGYSAIAHAGYALAGLTTASLEGVMAVLIYLAIYSLNVLGIFAAIVAMRRNNAQIENIADMAGLSRKQPVLAFLFALLMFSLAGVPPLAGFYGKFYIVMAAVRSGLFPLAIISVLSSVVAAYYYLRVVKVMYFDEASEVPFDAIASFDLRIVVGTTALYIVIFSLLPKPIIDAAQVAATGLVYHL